VIDGSSDITPEANILFASESIVDILGYRPDEVLGKSCFEYFHPEEVPFAHKVHDRTVELDKAAVLHYVRIKNRDGQWVCCECVFTVVYDVLVSCTSIYRGDIKNERTSLSW
jgi:PAS domain S-box-containing protein